MLLRILEHESLSTNPDTLRSGLAGSCEEGFPMSLGPCREYSKQIKHNRQAMPQLAFSFKNTYPHSGGVLGLPRASIAFITRAAEERAS
jgi:hypothetical protein